MIDLDLLNGIADDVREVLLEERAATGLLIKDLRSEIEGLRSAFASIPASPPGTPGTPGERGEKGIDGKDGRDGRDGIAKDGKDGRDAILTVTDEVDRRIQAEVERRIGVEVQKAVDAYVSTLPIVTYKGVYTEGHEYAAGNTATYGGSLWHANVSTREKPGTGAEWTLAVKRGRDGRDGK